MNTSLARRQQDLIGQVESEQQALADLQEELRKVETELTEKAPQRQKFQLLGVICESLDQLHEMGAASLFWGEGVSEAEHEQKIASTREVAEQFNSELKVLDEAQGSLQEKLDWHQGNLNELNFHLAEVTEELENSKYDFVIERDQNDDKVFVAGLLPWSKTEEDEKRQRKALLFSLVLMFLIGGIPAIWELPPPDPDREIEIPERLAKLVKEKAKPKPVKKPEQKKQDEAPKPDEPKVAKKEEPKPEEIKKARETAVTKGVLAHSDMFADLMDDSMTSNLGAEAKISGSKATGAAAANGAAGSRALITASAGGSGGVAASSAVSRGGVGSGGGNAISGSGLSTGQVQSAVAASVKESARPLTKGAGPSRTDEEIQIVFDRYKSALYRIYNRELRNNPSLRGKMVLELVIDPDGSVSACRVKSSDLDSPTLGQKIVMRVQMFNFGAKEGVPQTKILYPIDFLPAG